MAKLKMLFLSLILTQLGLAHPVAYQGAWGLMAFTQNGMQDWQITHSLTNRYSIGVEGVKDSMGGASKYYLTPKLNLLLHRWNLQNAQANIYLVGGAGLVSREKTQSAAFSYGAEADYETREFYLSGKFNQISSRSFDSTTLYQFRIGFAPYVADYEAFHTWVILSQQYFPNALDNRYEIGPVLRFYYRNVLWETGTTQNGSWIFNFMIHL